MQPEPSQQQRQRHQHTRIRGRRRGRAETSCGHPVLPVAAAIVVVVVALCCAGTTAYAFVPRSQPFRRHSLTPPPRAPPPATTGASWLSPLAQRPVAARASRMSLGEPPSAVMRRALQRAWQASSSEAATHEQLEVSDALDRLRLFKIFASRVANRAEAAWRHISISPDRFILGACITHGRVDASLSVEQKLMLGVAGRS